MRQWKKGLALLLGAGMLTVWMAGSALAAESRTKISSVKLEISSDITAGSDEGRVDATVASDASYEVTDVDVVNDEGDWSDGDIPRVEITLESDDGYYFASMSRSKVDLKGASATYVSSHREDSSSRLIITIKLDALEGAMEIDNVRWEDDKSPIADWEPTDGAKSFQVRLYRGNKTVGDTVTTTETTYNFISRITREGEYYFKVRGVNKSNKKGDWYESDYIYVDEEMLENIKSGNYSSGNHNTGNYNSGNNFNTSNNNSNGTTSSAPGTSCISGRWIWDNNRQNWWYQYSNGSYPVNGWLEIDNKWYCFDSVGWMRVGWIEAGGSWYYCDPTSGAMLTNTTINGYYVDANGVWIP